MLKNDVIFTILRWYWVEEVGRDPGVADRELYTQGQGDDVEEP